MKGLLFITHQTKKYDYLQSVEIALKGGCRQIQLRMKDTPVSEVEKVAFQAKRLCDKYNADLYIDDYVEVCLNVEAKGVHLGKLDMSPVRAREILGSRFKIGGTANTFDDIKKLNDERVDYVGLGPFRFTATKKNLSPVIGLEGYRRIIKQCAEHGIKLPIIAVGGITKADIADILAAGLSGIALSSAILDRPDPVKETEIINKIISTAGVMGTSKN
ncbi:MAG: thiamine phosphate synthase [Tannerella sp.]|jgi:thiamine-phosphate pyrophosphorylase|nr:thiamine phosphate synthase [Tannerella sp.]